MDRSSHVPCPYRTRRKRAGERMEDYCTAAPGGSSAWPQCTYCRDGRGGKVRKPKLTIRRLT